MADVQLEPGLVVDESVPEALRIMAGMPEFFLEFMFELKEALGSWSALAIFLNTKFDSLGSKRSAELIIDPRELNRIALIQEALKSYQAE